MKKWLYRILSKLRGKNSDSTPPEVIKDQLFEMRPLPMGRAEFEEWADRIIAGAMMKAEKESQVYALCQMIMSLGPTEHMKPDIHFISQLRKAAANQVADAIRKELYEEKKKRLQDEEKAKAEAEAIAKINEQVEATLARATEVTETTVTN